MTRAAPLRVGIVAGESSGDQLGAALIAALRERVPELQCFGVAGPKMIAAGCEAWAGAEELAVMGLTEVLRASAAAAAAAGVADRAVSRVPPRRVRRHRCAGVQSRPREASAREGPQDRPVREPAGLGVASGQSPQYRPRLRSGALPVAFRDLPSTRATACRRPSSAIRSPIRFRWRSTAKARARRSVLKTSATVVALLPGSRVGEVERLGTDFLQAAAWLAERRPDIEFIAPMATARAREAFESKQAEVPAAPKVLLLEGRAQQALAACDAAIVASGTATLETLLSRRPMVVAYRFGALTAFLLRRLRLVKVPYFSQPNLLVGRALVPEFLQEQVSGAALGEALLGRLSDPAYLRQLDEEFRKVHETLRGGAAARAAEAILTLLRAPGAQEARS